jgi:Tfp pilus assembly protein PilO
MHLPLRRIFDDKRRLVIPVLGGLALNAVLLVAVVYPLRARAESTEARAETAAEQLRAAERDDADARGVTEGRDRTDQALKAFYKEVLPGSHAQARQATFLRLTQLAEQHGLKPSRRSTDPAKPRDSSLARVQIAMTLQGNYEDIRRFIYHVESGSDFVVIDSVALRQEADDNGALTLTLALSTYYLAGADGP